MSDTNPPARTDAETLPPGTGAVIGRLAASGLSGPTLLLELADGASTDELLARHPKLTRQNLEALLRLAAGLVSALTPPHESATLPPSPSSADPSETLPPSGDRVHPPAVGLPSVPGYEVLRLLGEGGMGVVYHARQAGLNRAVALKMLRFGGAGPDAIARFRAEAEALARLQHPGIVQVHAVGEFDGGPFFALEFVPGGSLADRLDDRPMPAREAAALVERLSRAVHAAHEAGVIHRDLKPENVLLGGDGQPKVADFGLAKLMESDTGHTRTGEVMGTPSYMAPEQAEGKQSAIGPRTDVYALGAILYRLLTGRPPYRGSTSLDTVLQVIEGNLVPPRQLNPDVPRDLQTIILRALRRTPEGRYGSARALAEDLLRFLDGDAIRARPERPEERVWRWARRHPLPAVMRLTAGALLVGWLTYAIAWRYFVLGAALPALATVAFLVVAASGLSARRGPALVGGLVLIIPVVWLIAFGEPFTRELRRGEVRSHAASRIGVIEPDKSLRDELKELDRELVGLVRGRDVGPFLLPLVGGAVVGAVWRGRYVLRLVGLLAGGAALAVFLGFSRGEGLAVLAAAGLLGLVCRFAAWVVNGKRLDALAGSILGVGLVGVLFSTGGRGDVAEALLSIMTLLCPVVGAFLGALASRQGPKLAG
jgi:hypothetical protein